MTRTVTAGLDGSPESLAAAQWAAREAMLRDLPLRLVSAWEWPPSAFAPTTGLAVPVPPTARRAWARHVLDEARARVAARHPGLRIDADEIPGQPVPALLKAAEDARMLVLGSHGPSRAAGYLVGSVALSVLARSTGPVVLVRVDERPGGEPRTDDPPPVPGPTATSSSASTCASPTTPSSRSHSTPPPVERPVCVSSTAGRCRPTTTAGSSCPS
ncbi:universal stress protein [Streptomyces sp. NPDC050674]|uniref:universal stress protein n=1 Tax=Streptomyces sp. NPDC050674 TaxID=3157216 RepID=UPI003420D07A